MKGILFILLAAILVASLVLSCAAPPPAAPPPVEKPGAVPPPVAPPPAEEPKPKTRLEELIEGAKREGVVELWTSGGPHYLKILKPFKEKYPFLEVKIGDVSSGEALTRALTEAHVGKVSYDVYEASGEIVGLFREKGLLAEYDWPNVKGWPMQPNHKYWVNIGTPAKGPAYNTNLIPPDEAPKSWEDLKNPKYKKWGVMASTSADQMPMRLAAMWGEGGELNWEKSFDFWREVIKNNEPRVVRGMSGSIQLLAAGEDGLITTNTFSNIFELKSKGAPIELVPTNPLNGSTKTYTIPKNAPHPNAGMLLADWLTTPEAQLMFADLGMNPTLCPEAAEQAVPNKYLKGLGLEVYTVPEEFFTEENFKKSEEFWLTLLGVL
jgi:iron(III) transport system substrate-binding protein